MEKSAVWFDTCVDVIQFDKFVDLFLGYEKGWSHMVVIFADTGGAASSLLPNTAISSAEGGYFLSMFTFVL